MGLGPHVAGPNDPSSIKLEIDRCHESCLESKVAGLTVDGRNPAPVDMVNIPLFSGFHTSLVVQDFLHQQYHKAMLVNPFENGATKGSVIMIPLEKGSTKKQPQNSM